MELLTLQNRSSGKPVIPYLRQELSVGWPKESSGFQESFYCLGD